MNIILETERLLLRDFEPEDAEEAYRIMYRHPEVMRYLGKSRPHADADETRKGIGNIIQHREKYGFSWWAVVEKSSGQLVGTCGLKHLDNGPQVEVGYHIALDRWGNGFATEAAAGCVRYARETLDIEPVAVVHPDNEASRRVLEKIGMSQVGEGRYYGKHLLLYASRT